MNEAIPKHILIIEDDAFFSELLARNLLKRNFRVTTVEIIDDAKALLKKGGYDVVCFDAIVSGGDGMKNLTDIKTSGLFKNIPLVLLIDRGQEEETLQWVGDDAVAYVIKNESSPDEITAKIESLSVK